MYWDSNTRYCTGCGVEITVNAIIFMGKIYCCQDCLEGRPCDCGERMEVEEQHDNQQIPSSLIPN